MEPITTRERREESSADAEARESALTAHGDGGVSLHYDLSYPPLSRWRQMQIPVIASAVYWATRAIGPTLRFEVLGMQHVQRAHDSGRRAILAFWHRCIFSATWFWRDRNIVVMNTTNFDGQWTRKVIERLGYQTAQGSSSRGGLKGLVTMAKRLEEGFDVAFTIDGPRGPRYVAKPGPVMLARRTALPVCAFHIGLEDGVTFEKTWDQFQLPRPFSRAVVVIHPQIEVPPDCSKPQLEEKHAEMQRALERVRDVAEGWFRLLPEQRDALRQEFNGWQTVKREK
ncbi:MAG: lysophospholipid acyltransferase family protein [Candidatus Acidiferrales bacterium]